MGQESLQSCESCLKSLILKHWLHSSESLVIHESASLFLTQHAADFLQHVKRLTVCCGLSSVNGHWWALLALSRPLNISGSGQDAYCLQGCAKESSGAGTAVLTPLAWLSLPTMTDSPSAMTLHSWASAPPWLVTRMFIFRKLKLSIEGCIL